MSMDMRQVGQGMRRRFGGSMNHLQMAADSAAAAYTKNATLPGGQPQQGKLFNDSPSKTYDLSDNSGKPTLDWGGPHYPEE